MTVKGLNKLFMDPLVTFRLISGMGLLNWMSDERFLKIQYRLVTGETPDLEHPVTLNEKMQYLKLHDRRDEYTEMADKYAVKRLISEELGEEYVVPLLGVWDRPEDIDFDALPDRFVLKCTHDSGGHVICRDKAALDIPAAGSFLSKRLKRNYYWMNREWPYKNIRPRIIAEELLETDDGKLPDDYKFFFFGGELQYFVVLRRDKENNYRTHKFDRELNSIDHLFANPDTLDLSEIVFPENINEMVAVAERLGKEFRHIRIDLYNVKGKIYFGEYTFFNKGGYYFYPQSTSDRLASKIDLKG